MKKTNLLFLMLIVTGIVATESHAADAGPQKRIKAGMWYINDDRPGDIVLWQKYRYGEGGQEQHHDFLLVWFTLAQEQGKHVNPQEVNSTVNKIMQLIKDKQYPVNVQRFGKIIKDAKQLKASPELIHEVELLSERLQNAPKEEKKEVQAF
jgi:hypothetical protein